jgi:hypothetical protein
LTVSDEKTTNNSEQPGESVKTRPFDIRNLIQTDDDKELSTVQAKTDVPNEQIEVDQKHVGQPPLFCRNGEYFALQDLS